MGEPSTSSGDEEYGGSPASDSGTEAIIERLRYALTVLIECAARSVFLHTDLLRSARQGTRLIDSKLQTR